MQSEILKIIATRFSKTSQEVTLSITMRYRNHELIILLFSSNAKRFWKLHDGKNHYHEFVTYPEALSNCTAWTSDWVNQNPPQHVPIMPRTTKKNFDDFVTYPKALSNCIAWTSAWVNQKGYVTCSYNVTHDGKITITVLLHISNYSWTPERICNMFL